MEFDSLLTAVQGVMRSHQNSTAVSFAQVNKDKDFVSSKIIDSLDRLITELGLKVEYKRKINLFLVLNTNFSSIPSLEDDSNFWHLLGCLPKMSPYLYFKIASQLKFHDFIAEVIYFSPEFIGIEIFEKASDHMKFLSPEFVVNFFHSLCEYSFVKILELQKNNRPPIIIKKFVTALKTATAFNPAILFDNLDWKKEKKYIFFGYVTKMLLTLLESCISHMKSGFKYENIDVYDFNVDFDYEKWGECNNVINWTNHSLGLIAAKCNEAVMNISVDIYISWCEEDIKGSVDRTLQTAVRESAYNCREQIRSILCISDDISSLKPLETALNNIALQPITEDDEISRADPETIVMNLLNPSRTQTKWLKGLIRVPDILQSCTYMQVIIDNAHIFNLEVAKVLLNTLLDFLSKSQCSRDFYEPAKDCFFSCLKRLPLPLQMELLSYYFEGNSTSDILQKDGFDERLIESVNKFSATDENKNEMLKELVGLSFENCSEVVRHLLSECLSSGLRSELLLDLLSDVRPLGSVLCRGSQLALVQTAAGHLMQTVLTSLDKRKESFVQLVRQLCALELIEADSFFAQSVLPSFEETVSQELMDLERLLFHLELLHLYVSVCSKPRNSAVLLLFFAKFLEKIRPTHSNFSPERLTATSKTIDILRLHAQNLTQDREFSDGELEWLRGASKELKASTRLHLAPLWERWEERLPQPPSWTETGLGLGERLLVASSEERRSLVTSTLKVLPSLALSEWYLLGGGLDVASPQLCLRTLEAITDAVLVSFQVPFLVKKSVLINCILINLSQFLWEKGVPLLKTQPADQTAELCQKLTHLRDSLPQDLRKSRESQINLILQSIKK